MSKSIFASKTFWGAVIQLSGAIGLSPAVNINEMAGALALVVGFILTIYGRIMAEQEVTI